MLVISKQTLIFKAEGKPTFRLEQSTTPVVAPDWIRNTQMFEMAASDETLTEYERPGVVKGKQPKRVVGAEEPYGLEGAKVALQQNTEEKARQEDLRQKQATVDERGGEPVFTDSANPNALKQKTADLPKDAPQKPADLPKDAKTDPFFPLDTKVDGKK